jgi:hypothetical protein
MIRQTATFDPRGLLGRVYWYAILPIHNLIFSGLLGRIARRAGDVQGLSDRSVFTYHSLIPRPAADVFRWHERPEALRALLPSTRLVRIERQSGGVEDGACVVFSVGVGPLRMRWEARHYGYLRDRQFCDEQVRDRSGAGGTDTGSSRSAPSRASTRTASNTPCRAAVWRSGWRRLSCGFCSRGRSPGGTESSGRRSHRP